MQKANGKTNKKNGGGKRAKAKASQKASNGGRSTAKDGHVKATCSLTDPFCIAARGARRPDGMGQGTLPFQVRGAISVTTNAVGAALVKIVPGYGIYGYGNYTLAASVWDITAPVADVWTSLSGSAFLVNNAAFVRIVSMGAKFQSTASMTNCQGLVLNAVTTAGGPGATIPQMNLNNVEVMTYPMVSGMELTWVAKPLGASAHNFRAISEITNAFDDYDWTQCYFEVNGGAASTTVAIIEIVVNVEFQINQTGITTTGLGGVPLGTKPANPIALRAQEKVQSAMPGIIKGGVDAIEAKVSQFASNAVSDLVGTIGEGLAFLGL